MRLKTKSAIHVTIPLFYFVTIAIYVVYLRFNNKKIADLSFQWSSYYISFALKMRQTKNESFIYSINLFKEVKSFKYLDCLK